MYDPFSIHHKAEMRVAEWAEKNQKFERPDWISYYLNIAQDVSSRSHDSQSKCGAVITDSHFRPLSTGYNGFPPDVEDDLLPNYRPDKYAWVLHAEENAILSCHTKPNNDGKIFITGAPCLHCLILLWTFGVREVYHNDVLVNMMQNEEYQINRAIFARVTGGRMLIKAVAQADVNVV